MSSVQHRSPSVYSDRPSPGPAGKIAVRKCQIDGSFTVWRGPGRRRGTSVGVVAEVFAEGISTGWTAYACSGAPTIHATKREAVDHVVEVRRARDAAAAPVAAPSLRIDEATIPLSFEGEVEGFTPSEADEAYWTAFRLAEQGEPGAMPGLVADPAVRLRWAKGAAEGNRAHAAAQAHELGKQLGMTSEISEPPAGFLPHEAEAYRKGFAAGQEALAEEELMDDLWASSFEPDSGSTGVTDIDIWFSGRFA